MDIDTLNKKVEFSYCPYCNEDIFREKRKQRDKEDNKCPHCGHSLSFGKIPFNIGDVSYDAAEKMYDIIKADKHSDMILSCCVSGAHGM